MLIVKLYCGKVQQGMHAPLMLFLQWGCNRNHSFPEL